MAFVKEEKKYDQIKNFYEINDSWWLFFNLRLLKTRLILESKLPLTLSRGLGLQALDFGWLRKPLFLNPKIKIWILIVAPIYFLQN